MPSYLVDKSALLIDIYHAERRLDQKHYKTLADKGIEYQRKVLQQTGTEYYISSIFLECIHHKLDFDLYHVGAAEVSGPAS